MQLTIRIRERQLYGIDVNGANPNKILKIQHILMKVHMKKILSLGQPCTARGFQFETKAILISLCS